MLPPCCASASLAVFLSLFSEWDEHDFFLLVAVLELLFGALLVVSELQIPKPDSSWQINLANETTKWWVAVSEIESCWRRGMLLFGRHSLVITANYLEQSGLKSNSNWKFLGTVKNSLFLSKRKSDWSTSQCKQKWKQLEISWCGVSNLVSWFRSNYTAANYDFRKRFYDGTVVMLF